MLAEAAGGGRCCLALSNNALTTRAAQIKSSGLMRPLCPWVTSAESTLCSLRTGRRSLIFTARYCQECPLHALCVEFTGGEPTEAATSSFYHFEKRK